MPAARRHIPIDTGPGVDDAWAIALGLTSPEREVLALSSVVGDADPEAGHHVLSQPRVQIAKIRLALVISRLAIL